MRLDREWMRKATGRDDPRSTPWMPFPLFDFIALVAEALPESAGDALLEVGCGIGTRMRVAHDLYGLDCHGIDRVPEYVAQATELLPEGMPGVTAEVADALGWDGYGKYDLLWFNRPFADRVLQRQLEAQVWSDMKPGDAAAACLVAGPDGDERAPGHRAEAGGAMTMPHPGARQLVDTGNQLLSKAPVTLDTGSVETPEAILGVVTFRTASVTLTAFLTAAELKEWSGLLDGLADQLSGTGLVKASPQDLSLLTALARKRKQP
jgi:hypothetical protein